MFRVFLFWARARTGGDELANATLVAWATEGPNLETDLLRLPLATINLILDSTRPILVSESVLGHHGVAPGQGAHLFLHDAPVDEFTEIVPTECGDATAGLAGALVFESPNIVVIVADTPYRDADWYREVCVQRRLA